MTDVTVGLHARAELNRTVAITVVDGDAGVQRIGEALRALPFRPYACEIVNDALARALGLADHTVVLARLAGNEESIGAQRSALERLGDMRDVGDDVWTGLRNA